MKLLSTPSLFTLTLLVISLSGLAQDNHYAWMQFGSRNSILNNANLSRFEDQSAVIINPATLSEATQSSFNFSTNAVGFNTINFKNGLGEGFTIKNSSLTILPSLAAGVIKPKKSEKDMVIGYALYTSNTDLLNFSDRVESKIDLINETESPGNENYLAQYNVNTNLDELSIVGGIGWKLSPVLSLGISQNFIYRAQEYAQKFSAYALADQGSGASVDLTGTNYDYYTKYFKLATFTKIGIVASLKEWNLGLTLSTPALGIMGQGYILADMSLSNVRLSEDLSQPRRNFLANGEFDKLKVTYKTPVNAALGINRSFGKVRLYGSVSWFGNINAYNILDPGDAAFLQPPSEDNVLYTNKLLSLWSINHTVINGSIAADWAIRDDYHLLFSFRTDAHYSEFDKQRQGFNTSIKQWDNYHLTIGAQRNFGWSEWVVGLRYNYAKNKDYPQPISFTDPSEDNFFRGETSTGTIRSTGLQLMLSYTFTFGKTAEE
ncbi:MAG: hypothetical protein IPL92_12520 [Saprospiraceae bacterium]|nr:hypothetical protein [Candidatus Opimibacter iunctus]